MNLYTCMELRSGLSYLMLSACGFININFIFLSNLGPMILLSRSALLVAVFQELLHLQVGACLLCGYLQFEYEFL